MYDHEGGSIGGNLTSMIVSSARIVATEFYRFKRYLWRSK